MLKSEFKNRDFLFDNLKGFLIISVLLMHILEYKNEGVFLYMRSAVYIFHMPLFIMISGRFSKNLVNSKGKIKSVFQNCLVPYLIFNTAYMALIHDFGIKQIFTPKFIYWYFFCLFVWRLVLPIFVKINKYFLLFGSVVLSVAAGFVPWLDRFLSLQRLLAFLPFFLIGFYIDNNEIQKIRILKKPACIAALIATACVSAYLYSNIFTCKSLENIQCYAASEMSNLKGALARIISIALAVIISACLINIFPNNKSMLSVIGQRTALIYPASGFLQLLAFKLLNFLNIFDKICGSYWLLLLFALAFTAFSILLCSEKHIYRLFTAVMNGINRFLFLPFEKMQKKCKAKKQNKNKTKISKTDKKQDIN